MDNKWILYVGNFDAPEVSAAGKRVYSNALIFRDIGYDVKLIGKSKTIEKIKFDNGIEFCSFPQYSIKDVNKYMNYLKENMKEAETKPCVIVRYGSPSIAFFDYLLYQYCRMQKIKLVVDVVDWLGVSSGNILFNYIKGIDTWFEKAVLNKLGSGIITISSYLSNLYKDSYDNSIIIPPLVEKYATNSIDNDIPLFIYAGTPFRLGVKVTDPKKIKDRVDILIEMFSAVDKKNSYILNVVGISKNEYLVAFPKHKELLDDETRIVFHGRKKMAEVQKMIGESDYSVLIRDKNRATMAGFPTKVVESLSMGTPVITTDTSDLTEYISDGENGFIVEKFDIVRLNEIVLSSKSDRKVQKEKCACRSDFLYTNYVDSVRRFLESILQEEKG